MKRLDIVWVPTNQFSSVQLLSRVRLFAAPWTVACQASLSITNSQSLLKLMSIESVISSNHLVLCHPFLLLPSIFPSIRVFLISQLFPSGGQSIGASASASVLPMNIQDSAFFMVQLSHPYMTTRKTITLTIQTFVSKVLSLLSNMLSRLVIAFLTRSMGLLISWLQNSSMKTYKIF